MHDMCDVSMAADAACRYSWAYENLMLIINVYEYHLIIDHCISIIVLFVIKPSSF